MRICADPRSPHYHADWMGSHVWLDGKRLTHVVEACEESGWVIRDKTDADGNVLIEGNKYLAREILRGRVSIVNPRWLPAPVPRKLIVLVLEGVALSNRSVQLIQWFRKNDDLVEIVVIEPGRTMGWKPCGIWIDDMADLIDDHMQRKLLVLERWFLYGTGESYPVVGSGLVACNGPELERPVVKHISPNCNERAWNTKRRKGRQ